MKLVTSIISALTVAALSLAAQTPPPAPEKKMAPAAKPVKKVRKQKKEAPSAPAAKK